MHGNCSLKGYSVLFMKNSTVKSLSAWKAVESNFLSKRFLDGSLLLISLYYMLPNIRFETGVIQVDELVVGYEECNVFI